MCVLGLLRIVGDLSLSSGLEAQTKEVAGAIPRGRRVQYLQST